MNAEEKVFLCIAKYRKDDAKRISKAYGNGKLIITTLKRYPNVHAYHGHMSGNSTDGTSQSADQNLDAAIKFLNENQPAEPQLAGSSGKSVDTQKKKENESYTQLLLGMIEAESNLGTLKTALDDFDSNWESNKAAKQAYDLKRENKKKANQFKTKAK